MIKKLWLGLIFIFVFASIVVAADSMTGGTWQFDSTGAKTSAIVNVVWVIWNGCTTSGHVLELREYPSGNLIVKRVCVDENIDSTIQFPGTSGSLNGIEVRTLGSGNIQLRLGKY
jgi:hypothetical protein